ncbi:MAG: hypothetical protein D6761_05670 [Candidatus Dadabacteria bacterium]|nr:MAG: hypothetical protein D6761_05670 [Candidatus Dadabacteria bacterium]
MRGLTLALLVCCGCNTLDAASQDIGVDAGPVIASGFEPNTALLDRSGSLVLSGTDLQSGFDWAQDLEAATGAQRVTIQFQGGTDQQRRAWLTDDPVQRGNRTICFELREPNVGGQKGRVQANLYDTFGFSRFSQRIRLYLGDGFSELRDANVTFDWLTLFELWNNPNWTDDPWPFRISVNLIRQDPDRHELVLGAHGQTYTDGRWENVWEVIATDQPIAVETWTALELEFVEGNASTGRFVVRRIEPAAATLLDVTNWTHHPDDANPDGLTHLNPFKLYTSAELINGLHDLGTSLSVCWDDWQFEAVPR